MACDSSSNGVVHLYPIHVGAATRPIVLRVISRWVCGAFASLLLLVGTMGFVAGEGGTTSGAPAYNVFHLCFGAIGLGVALWGDSAAIRGFLVGFGLIDLYQALASAQHWFPELSFRWTRADDVLHVIIGVALIAVGALL